MSQFGSVGFVVCGIALAAIGSSAEMRAADKRSYSLFNPTPDHLLRDLSTDRPDKTESPYTVDAGRIQIETDLVAYTHDRQDGITTRAFDVLPFNLKIGLTSSTDLQLVYGTYAHVRASSSGATETDNGKGDLVIRLKHNVWGNDVGATAIGLMPFVKIPTNNMQSLNDDVEGGLIVPFAIDLGRGMGLGLMTEIDILRARDGSGYEPTFVNSAALGFELTDTWGMYVEAYVERSAESGTKTIATVNSGFTYAVTKNLQLDAGANIGVTDAADDLNFFVGMSQRF